MWNYRDLALDFEALEVPALDFEPFILAAAALSSAMASPLAGFDTREFTTVFFFESFEGTCLPAFLVVELLSRAFEVFDDCTDDLIGVFFGDGRREKFDLE